MLLCTFHDRAGFSADVRRQRSFEDWRAAVAQGKAVRLRFARALLGKQRKCFLAWRDWYRQNLEERRGPRKVVEAVVALQARQRGPSKFCRTPDCNENAALPQLRPGFLIVAPCSAIP